MDPTNNPSYIDGHLPHTHHGSYINTFATTHADTRDVAAFAQKKIAPYLAPSYLTKKATNIVKAKILPLSTPEDLAMELKKAQKHLLLLKRIKHKTCQLIENLSARIQVLEKKGILPKRLEALKNKRSYDQQRLEEIKNTIKTAKQFIEHLQTKKMSQISGRMTGYAGSVANWLVPGSGLAVNALLTALTAALPVISVRSLKNSAEKRNVNLGTAITAFAFIASTASSLYLVPTIKEIAWNTFFSSTV